MPGFDDQVMWCANMDFTDPTSNNFTHPGGFTTGGDLAIGTGTAAPGQQIAVGQITGAGGISVSYSNPNIVIDGSGVPGTALTVHTDSGDAVESAGAITLAGGNNISTSGSGSTATVSVSGTTNHTIQLGNASGSLTSATALTNGQLLIGSTGADPVAASLTAGTNITITPGAGSITIDASGGGGGLSTLTTDSGTATESAGNINLVGGNNISTSGATDTATISVSGTTNHAIQLGNASGSLSSLSTGSTGQVLQANTGADPSWSTPTYPSTSGTSGKVLISDGTNNIYSTPTFPNASASSGKFIRSDGTNWIASTPTLPTSAGTSGKVLQSDGTNYVESTPTYPSTSGTSRKIIVSDGTNNVYSTETWAVPGTSGNVLTSDGTNWTSAAPSSGGLGYALQMMTGSSLATPADATTYYCAFGVGITTATTSGGLLQKIIIPQSGTLDKAYGNVRVAGTLSSAQNATIAIRLNNTTSTNVSTSVATTAISNDFSGTSLGITVAAGDYIEVLFITPTWTTNPTQVSITITMYIS